MATSRSTRAGARRGEPIPDGRRRRCDRRIRRRARNRTFQLGTAPTQGSRKGLRCRWETTCTTRRSRSASVARSAGAGLLEKGAMVAAVSAVPLSAGPARKTRIARDRGQGDHAQADELVPVRAGPPRGLEHDDGRSSTRARPSTRSCGPGWPANQYADHVNTQVQAGGIDADVMTLIPDLAARLVKQGDVLAPINSIVKKVGVHPSASHNYIRKGGNLYGISIVEVAFGLLYNKALLDEGRHQAAGDRSRGVAAADGQADQQAQPVRPLLAQHDGRAVLVLVHSPGLGQRLRRQVGDRQEAQPDGSEGHQDAHASGRSSTTRRSRRARTTPPRRACSRTGRSPRS